MTGFAFLLIASAVAQTQPDSWSEMSGPPVRMGNGGAVAAVDATTIYAICGGTNAGFCRLNLATGSWTRLADLPLAPAAGGSLGFRPGTQFLYATTGANTANKRGFYRYDMTAGTWKKLADFPVDETGGVAIAATADRVYALAGASGFHEYAPSADPDAPGAWAPKAAPPAASGSGAALVGTGGDFLYAVRGGWATTDFFRYSISGANGDGQAAGTWEAMPSLPAAADPGSALTALGSASLLFLAGNSTELHEYSIAAKSWAPRLAPPADATCPAMAKGGAGLAYPPGAGDIVYVFFGQGANLLGRYSRSTDRYLTPVSQRPSEAGAGSGLTVIDGVFYTFSGGGSELWSYAPATDTWTQLGDLPGSTSSGAALAYDGAGLLYACQGNQFPWRIWRYAISGDNAFNQAEGTWIVRAYQPTTAPAPTFLFDGTGFLGTWGASLRRYLPAKDLTPETDDPSVPEAAGDAWTSLAAPPGAPGAGGGAVKVGGDAVYFLRGGGSDEFWSYSIASNTWNATLAKCPYPVNAGGAICYCPIGNTIFVTTGCTTSEGTSRLLAYSLDDDTWDLRAETPGAPGDGAAIAYPGTGKYLYMHPAGGTRALWRYSVGLTLADPATGANQYRFDGTTPVPPGGTIRAGELVVRATVTHPRKRQAGLELQVSDEHGTFAVLPTASTGLVPSGSEVTLKVGALSNGPHRWQVRTVNELDNAGPWVPFGAGGTDFVFAPDTAPFAGAAEQACIEDDHRVGPGQGSVGTGIRIRSVVSDPDGDAVRLRVEIRRMGEAFTGVATAETDFVPSGTLARADIDLVRGEYQWQTETVDEWGLPSGWTPYGDAGIDLRMMANGSANLRAGCSAAGSGTLVALLLLVPLLSRFRG